VKLKSYSYLSVFQEHEDTSMEGVQICGISNSSSPPCQSEDNKHPLKFGESVVNINIPNLSFEKGHRHRALCHILVLGTLHMNLENIQPLSCEKCCDCNAREQCPYVLYILQICLVEFLCISSL